MSDFRQISRALRTARMSPQVGGDALAQTSCHQDAVIRTL
jgi:hypothetical protein